MGGLTRLSSEMLWQAYRIEKRPLKASVLHGVHNTTATCLAHSPPLLLSFSLSHSLSSPCTSEISEKRRKGHTASYLLIVVSSASIFITEA